jgi:hypothetical protein
MPDESPQRHLVVHSLLTALVLLAILGVAYGLEELEAYCKRLELSALFLMSVGFLARYTLILDALMFCVVTTTTAVIVINNCFRLMLAALRRSSLNQINGTDENN